MMNVCAMLCDVFVSSSVFMHVCYLTLLLPLESINDTLLYPTLHLQNMTQDDKVNNPQDPQGTVWLEIYKAASPVSDLKARWRTQVAGIY